MRPRSTNLRTKVFALLASLVALWAFAAWVTLREGVNLLGVQAVNSQIVSPSEPLLLKLQVERRLAVAYLAGPTTARREAFDAVRSTVDKDADSFKAAARSWRARLAGDAETEQHVEATVAALDGLSNIRKSIDDRSIDRGAAASSYSAVIVSLFQLYDVVSSIDDPDLKEDGQHLIELYRVRELISQEDALLSGALVAGGITTDEYLQFTQLASVQRYLASQIEAKLRQPEQTLFRQVITGESFADLRRLEQQIISADRKQSRPAITVAEWDRVSHAALTELQEMVLDSGHALADRAAPVAIWVIVRLVLAAGLGLLAVIASIIVSITTARALVAQLQRLRDAAHQLADERLPSVVERLGRGEKVDIAVEAPPLDFGADEIGQVGQAFNRVQETAVRTAVEQAELRRNVRDVFLSLARRTQGLVHRQVTLLDAMERREHDADELEDLFRVDHLATRMRRNAENLIVLSGAAPGRAWRRDVPMIDVARAATQEVEDYTRVTVLPFGSVGLAGRAAGDVIHLLAELVENALSFSPPNTEVEVRGQEVARGFAIEVEDRGLGMSEEELAEANDRIASPTEFNLANAKQLGLFVVSHLAQRHDISVKLKASPYGGTTAVVLIPSELVTKHDAPVGTSPEVGGLSAGRPSVGRGGGLPATEERQGSVVLTEPLPGHQPTMELPAVGSREPQRRAADDPATGMPEPTGAATQVRQRAQPNADRTPQGLPVRVRQASLAPQLRADADPASEASEETATARSPEQIRKLMSRYQTGTRRGRDDARLLTDEDAESLVADDSPASGTDR
ncbi:nitrate- and nitrite sensing domain-containing protein [Micromonospora sp. NPDC006766]|uniref:sensor histidine kinase n=1 Tax=Micromonospora sp. NPDC006766 TaxID=3154778 RepID=UPI0034099A78